MTEPPAGTRKSRLASAGLVLLSTLLTVLALEVTFRLHAWWTDAKTPQEALGQAPRPTPTGRVHLNDIIALSANESIVYELKPHVAGIFRGGWLTTNSLGFRDGEYAERKALGVVRIIGLGDSMMFGWGVADGEDYLALVEQRLGVEGSGARWEVLNTAVPGYNTVMEVAYFKEKALRFAPDLVLVGYCENDLELPRFLMGKKSYVTLEQSFLWQFVTGRLRSGDEASVVAPGLEAAPHRKNRRLWATFATDPAAVPPQYAHMVGLDAFRRALAELQALGKQHGFQIVVLFHPSAPEDVASVVRELRLDTLETQPAVDRLLAERGLADLVGSPLTISATDFHPSVVGHQLIATALIEGLRAKGYLDPARYRR